MLIYLVKSDLNKIFLQLVKGGVALADASDIVGFSRSQAEYCLNQSGLKFSNIKSHIKSLSKPSGPETQTIKKLLAMGATGEDIIHLLKTEPAS